MRRSILAFPALLLALVVPPVSAQLVLNLPLERYTVGPFTYAPPSADGWRATEVSAGRLGFVFAERQEAAGVNIRADVALETFPIPAGAEVGSLRHLTELARAQQAAQRKEALVRASAVTTVPGGKAIETYTLVSRAGGDELYEVFFVMLGPERKAYLVMKFATLEVGYNSELFWMQFYGSLSSLVPST